MIEAREGALQQLQEIIAVLRSLPLADDQERQLAQLKQTRHLIDLLELDSAAQLRGLTAAVQLEEMNDLCNQVRVACNFTTGQLCNQLDVGDSVQQLPQSVAAVEAITTARSTRAATGCCGRTTAPWSWCRRWQASTAALPEPCI